MKVLFLTKYDKLGASSRYRFFQFFDSYEKHNIECITKPFFDDLYIENLYKHKFDSLLILKSYIRRFAALFGVKKYDLVVIEKELFPYFPAIFEKLFSSFSIKYVVDYDDALFHQYDKHRLAIVRVLLGSKISSVMKNSSLVIAGNQYLADYAIQANAKRVVVIPTVIDIQKYTKKEKYNDKNIIIGWIGSPSTAKYVANLEAVLLKLREKYRIKIYLIGASKSPFEKLDAKILPWNEVTEVKDMKKFDIGIMPLVDSFWERGKCGFKLIQYMGCSLPVVGSPVGVNRDIIDNEVNGLSASTNKEWYTALEKLILNKELRIKYGNNGRNKVIKKYSKLSVENILISLYISVQKK